MDLWINWLISHQGILAGVVVSILDLVFALRPDWESSGVLHWIYLQLKKLLPGSHE